MKKYEMRARFKQVLATEGAVTGDDFNFVRGMLDNHPDAAEKIGPGVAEIFVDKTKWNNNGLYVRRVDGTVDDFSYRLCITGKEKSERAEMTHAMREAVSDQILSFKHAMFQDGITRCAITDEIIARDKCHVDHAPTPFRDLVDRFLTLHRWDESDPASIEQWKRFHADRAELQLTTAAANLAKG